ncbi:ring-cleaving dioxygenase [Globicatella sanguinis]
MMQHELLGIHHVTAMTDSAERNYQFFTEILGMRLVKKTVNQDDIHTYHTFYADDVAAPGTDMTFFDFPNNPKGLPGTNLISRIGLRVPNDQALNYYQKRFKKMGIKHDPITEVYGVKVLPFEEQDGQKYQLFSDEHNQGIPAGTPWKKGPVPAEFAITGLGPIEITISYFEDFRIFLETVYGMKTIELTEERALLEVGEGGNGGRVILINDSESGQSQPGYGQVHHVSFRVKDHEALMAWLDRYNELGIRSSGFVDRFYFEALYTRVGHILIELSTDGPGFMQDEPYETLGEKLSLPPFLEPKRAEIEAQVRPFDTVWRGVKEQD